MNKHILYLLLLPCLILSACSNSEDNGQPRADYPLLLTQLKEQDPFFDNFISMALSPDQTRLYAVGMTYGGSVLYTFGVTNPANPELSGVVDAAIGLPTSPILLYLLGVGPGGLLYSESYVPRGGFSSFISSSTVAPDQYAILDELESSISGMDLNRYPAMALGNDGNTILVCSSADGLEVVDVSDPSAMIVVGQWMESYCGGVLNPGSCDPVDVEFSPDESAAFVAATSGGGGVGILDLSDPVLPTLFGPLLGGGGILDLEPFAYGALLAVGRNAGPGEAPFEIWDVADYTSPMVVGQFVHAEAAMVDMLWHDASANIVYGRLNVDQLVAYDVTDPMMPQLLFEYAFDDVDPVAGMEIVGIAVRESEGVAFVARSDGKIDILKLLPP